jgi:predicted anti-sigma-YlaC factor YlaD
MRAVERHHSPTPEEIMEYLDGEGAASARETIAAHLATCADCQVIAADQQDISAHAQAWTVDRAPASLTPPEPWKKLWVFPMGWFAQPRAAALTFAAAGVTVVLVTMTAVSVKRNASPARSAVNAEATEAHLSYAKRMPPRTEQGAIGGVVDKLDAAPAVVAQFAAVPQATEAVQSSIRTPAIIRTATLRLIAKDFAGARANVEALIKTANGFIDRMTVTGEASSQRQLVARLRVPGDRLADALSRLRQLGAVVEDTQGSDDVTDQIVDLDARITNARATEKRLAEILQNRTGRLSDVLEVERELARVRLDVERLDAEKTNLARRVSYATMDLTIVEERKSAESPLTLGTRLRLAALDGVENVQDTVAELLLFTLRAGPSLVFWAVLLAIAWFVGRRFKGSPA